MNSVQQTILGLVLVGIAFIFGSYLHRDGNPQIADNQVNDSENLKWQDHSSSLREDLENGSQSNQAMPNLNSAQSSMPKLVEANLVPDLGNESVTSSEEVRSLDRPIEVVEPDFSRFAIGDSDHRDRSTVTTESTSGQQPDFASHFPKPITGTVENIRPKMPKRDETFGSSGASPGSELTETRLNMETPNNTSSVLNNSNRAAQSQLIQNDHYQAVHTETVVTSIRPRNNSPVMKNTQEYRDHQTAAGETLQSLAVKYFGDPAYYLDIYVANQDLLRSPGDLPLGITLRIPIYQ